MMKQFYTLILTLFSIIGAFGQIPPGYYDSATGTGYALKSQLKVIITNGHTWDAGSYDDLFNAYTLSDIDNYYEDDGTILDIYSENPTGSEIAFSTSDQCGGNIPNEGLCYNREHVFPQGFFNNNDNLPMVSDIHHVIPTDGFVNNGRSNYPFGVVTNPNTTYANGSRWGTGNNYGYTGRVFEPIDEFKGDIARILLYFAVRYEDNWNDSGWDSHTTQNNPLNGTSDQFYETWVINTLLDWHNADPVSPREVDRNNAAYNFQGNRNPFIDNPGYANAIWDADPDTTPPTAPTNLMVTNVTSNTADLSWTAGTDDMGIVSHNIYINGTLSGSSASSNPSFTASGLSPETNYCFRVSAVDAAGNESPLSNEVCVTTGTGPGGNCLDEDFSNVPGSSSSYSDRTWTGNDGKTFNATDARTDQNLDGKAITIRNGSLEITPMNNEYIDELTVTTQRVFGGSSGTFDLVINGSTVGTIPYSDTATTTTIPVDINNITSLVINNNSVASNRVMFDNLSWTCGLLNVNETDISNIQVYPNPVDGDFVYVNTKESINYQVYSILGKLVLKGTTTQGQIKVGGLSKGVYLIKIVIKNQTKSLKLIKQ